MAEIIQSRRVKSVRDSVDPGLRVALLGAARVEVAGRPVSLATRKTVALLAYLLIEPGPHPRQRLSGLFWPDSDPQRGRAALRTTLGYLRDALGSESARLSGNRDWLALDRTGVELDLDAPDPGSTDLFLDGLAFDDAPELEHWVSIQRERWRRQLLGHLQRAALLHLERHHSPEAVASAERCLMLEPLDEPSLRLLLEAHLQAGQAVEAWGAFCTARDRLDREVGRRLSADTEAVAERARAALGVIVDSTRSALDRLEAAFVGRTSELLQLSAALHGLPFGPRVVLVEGEPGIGKTRLSSEFIRRAAASGADVLRGRAAQPIGESTVPYATIVDVLRARLERENAPEDLLDDVWLAELSRLFPELLERYPDLPQASVDDGAGVRLFEAVARLIQALAERAPLVLFVDDLQWADSASREMLRYCVARWTEISSHVLVLCSVRDGADPRWIDDFVVNPGTVRVDHLRLGPISSEDTLSWIGVGPGRSAFGHWLRAETDGNPFFMTETLRILVEDGVLLERPAPGGPLSFDFEAALHRETELRGVLPPRVRDVIGTRVARLTDPERRVLSASAVIGSAASVSTLSAVSDLDIRTTLDVVDRLVASRWLVEESSSTMLRLRLSHDQQRETIYAGLSNARRQDLHQRALNALQLVTAPPAVLAAQARAAGLRHETIEWSITAGEQALAVFATREAIEFLGQARELASSSTAPALLRRLYANLGRAFELAGELPAARDTYAALRERARADRLDSLACLALNRLATLAAQAEFDLGRSLALLEQARIAAQRSGEPLDRAETFWNLAQVGYYARDLSSARDHAEEGLALARQIGDADLLGRCLNVSMYVLLDLGEAETAGIRGEEAVTVFRELGNRALEADSLALLCGIDVVLGRAKSGIHRARAALELGTRIRNRWSEVFSRYHLALALVERDELGDAERYLNEALQLGESGGVSLLLLRLARNALGTVQRAQGRFETACATHIANIPPALLAAPADARPLAQPLALALLDGLSLSDLCADQACLGDWSAAADCARKVLVAVDRVPAYARMHTLWCEVAALVRGGNRDAAIDTLQAFVRSSGDQARYAVTRLRAEAELALTLGEREAFLMQARTMARELDLPLEVRELGAGAEVNTLTDQP